MPKYLTAIVVSRLPGSSLEQFAKYRKIPAAKVEKFVKFAASAFPGLHHINLYDRDKPKGQNFYRQISLKEIVSIVGSVGQFAGQSSMYNK